jgi:hypothetical protein
MAKLICSVSLSGKMKRKVKLYAFVFASFKFLCPVDSMTEKLRVFLFGRLRAQLDKEIECRFKMMTAK